LLEKIVDDVTQELTSPPQVRGPDTDPSHPANRHRERMAREKMRREQMERAQPGRP